jgi:hypothetical protein
MGEVMVMKMLFSLGEFGACYDFVRRLRITPRFCSVQHYPHGLHSGNNIHTDAHFVTFGFVVVNLTGDDPSLKASLFLTTGPDKAPLTQSFPVNLMTGEAVAVPFNVYHGAGTDVRPDDRCTIIIGW